MLYERDVEASALREVSPRAGAALAFPHGKDNPDSVWHAGMPVAGGVKYIIRTDVIYGPAPPVASPQAASSALPDATVPEPQHGAPRCASFDEEQARAAFYEVDEHFAGPGSPIVCIIGGEGAVPPSTGIFYPWVVQVVAKRLGALVIQPEHR